MRLAIQTLAGVWSEQRPKLLAVIARRGAARRSNLDFEKVNCLFSLGEG